MLKKLTEREIKHIIQKHHSKKLNISREAKRLGISRRTIYFHLWNRGLVEKKTQKKKTLWQRIKAYFGISTYWEHDKN